VGIFRSSNIKEKVKGAKCEKVREVLAIRIGQGS
jgi:hypothetical protein